jgi:hypothetical protein
MNRITRQATSYLIGIVLLLSGNAAFAAHEDCTNPEAYPNNGCSLPGIRDGGYPYFDYGVKVTYKDKNKKNDDIDDFKVKAKWDKKSGQSVLTLNLDEFYFIGKPKYKFTAEVKDGVLKKGSVKIQGIIQDLGITKRTTLMEADLEGDWAFSLDGQLLGFDTTNIVCHEAIAQYCTTAESVYLALAESINGVLGTGKKLKTTGTAITTIPIPAAAWLFGSGLLCLAGIARKRRHTG